jgi:hypothetical protein
MDDDDDDDVYDDVYDVHGDDGECVHDYDE